MKTNKPKDGVAVKKRDIETTTFKHDFVLPPKGKRTKSIRIAATYEDDTGKLVEVDQAICRHLLRFGFFEG